MSSLLEDPPMPTRSRGWGHYLLPALVLLNVLLMLSLLGVLPPVFGDQPDPGRLSRQIDADRVRVVPGGAAAAEAASSAGRTAAAQDADKQADAAPQGAASGSHQNAAARSADRQNATPASASRNSTSGTASARQRQDGNRRQEPQAGNRSSN